MMDVDDLLKELRQQVEKGKHEEGLTLGISARRVTSGSVGPKFVKTRLEIEPAIVAPKESRVHYVPDPVAVFLARLSPETQEMIRLDLIARIAGIISGLSEHKETEERIAELEAFDKLADKIAKTPEWASF